MSSYIVKNDNGYYVVLLPPSLTMNSLAEFFKHLSLYDQGDKGLILDASKCNQISTAAVQLIISVHKSLEKKGKKLHINSPTKPLTATLYNLGLEKHLKTWEACNTL